MRNRCISLALGLLITRVLAAQQSFVPEEATIRGTHAALASGQVTCVQIVRAYLDRNGVLSNSTGFPAIAFPGGFSAPTSAAPVGVPVGIELLGPDWSEPVLIKLAYAFEQFAKIRKPPASTPPLSR